MRTIDPRQEALAEANRSWHQFQYALLDWEQRKTSVMLTMLFLGAMAGFIGGLFVGINFFDFPHGAGWRRDRHNWVG